MNVSHIKLIGSIIQKTKEALNRDASFLEGLKGYAYHEDCLIDGVFNLWHYPGTQNEISMSLLHVGEDVNGAKVKFPSVFSFQPVRQERSGTSSTVLYNLAFVGRVGGQWLTQYRDEKLFKLVLRPVYAEFMHQLSKSGYFHSGYGMPEHSYIEAYTTEDTEGTLLKRYGDFIDAIEVHNLRLSIKNTLCDKDFEEIERNDSLVTENFKNILNR